MSCADIVLWQSVDTGDGGGGGGRKTLISDWLTEVMAKSDWFNLNSERLIELGAGKEGEKVTMQINSKHEDSLPD